MTKIEADNFRGLLYNPMLENEVVMLFSLLIPHLEDSFVIEEYSGTFPDCFALRNGQRVGIEFELYATNFFDHKHHEDDNLTECSIILCWENDIPRTIKRDGKEFLKVKHHEIEHEIEIISLKDKSLGFIKYGERPDVFRKCKESFFEQLKEKIRPKNYEWIKELYDHVNKNEDFEVKWGGGRTWSTMRFYVRKWRVNPISVYGDGSVEIGYQGNKAIFPWFELQQETKTELRQIFKNPKPKWYKVPLDNETDLDNIYKALKILAEHSKRFDDVIWHTKD
jgi:hypothetical protein